MIIGNVLGDARQRGKLLYLPKGFLCYKNSCMGENRKCEADANYGEPSQTMFKINKAVLFHDFHRGDVNPKHIQIDLCHK